MNSNAVLALIGDMYAQLAEAQDRIAELEQELAEGHENGVRGSSAAVASPAQDSG